MHPDIAEAAQALIDRALREDIGSGDVTSEALIASDAAGHAEIISRGDCVVAGIDIAAAVFRAVDPSIEFERGIADGRPAAPGAVLAALHGPLRGILTGERTALNFLQRLTGIATLTRRFVDRVNGLVQILDTRKTTPGYRAIEKYAVRCGGGTNHRRGLYDMALLKDTHRAYWSGTARRDLGLAVDEIRRRFPNVPIEIEVESLEDLERVLPHRPDWVMLDNMPPERVAECVKACAGRARLEASGGITLDTVERYAATGVDAISIGALTHSAPAADLSLELR